MSENHLEKNSPQSPHNQNEIEEYTCENNLDMSEKFKTMLIVITISRPVAPHNRNKQCSAQYIKSMPLPSI